MKKDIAPTERPRVIDLVREAGVDVSDWSNCKGGQDGAAKNPKYCYEWAFLQRGKVVVLNLWHDEMHEIDNVVTSELNLKHAIERETVPNRKARAARRDNAIRMAIIEGLPVRVIVLAGERRKNNGAKATRTSKRRLDTELWAVAEYDVATGACVILRGAVAVPAEVSPADDILQWFEGAARMRFVRHRRREQRARRAKLEDARARNTGRLVCEVPRCGFDFAEKYGTLGEDYAQVHHLEPLSDAPDAGRPVDLNKLAVVCANCHVMVHIGGQCRDLNSLIPER